MSFSKLREQITTDLDRIDSIQDYQRIYLSKEVIQSIKQLNKKFIEHLLKDLVNSDQEIEIRSFLSDKYHDANDYALECIEPAFYKTNIHGARIKTWTNSALKCFDVFLIKLINDYQKERIKKSGRQLKERDVYDHLIKKKGSQYEIGIAFQTIYQQRSSFTHVQFETKDGVRSTKRWSNSKYNITRDLILAQFEKGLNALIKEIKTYGI
tara:strand:+ start:225 stop:854 length:630 start_codon:yes stop_codon:yes gene_type:complete